jgi:ankyrin
MTVDDMKSLGDDSLKIDVTRDEKTDMANDSGGMYIFILLSL